MVLAKVRLQISHALGMFGSNASGSGPMPCPESVRMVSAVETAVARTRAAMTAGLSTV